MLVVDFDGQHQVVDEDALDKQLSRRSSAGVNHFWLYFDEEEYPWLAIAVKQDIACVHFFPKEGHPGFQSVGSTSANETITFYMTADDTIEVPQTAVVPINLAMIAAHEFMHGHGERPSAVKWLEL